MWVKKCSKRVTLVSCFLLISNCKENLFQWSEYIRKCFFFLIKKPKKADSKCFICEIFSIKELIVKDFHFCKLTRITFLINHN
jgi:hypothetical protein